jgi:hypothetical protein
MRIGIVGSEAAKFTPETQARARQLIRAQFAPGDVVISGGCHLGGIDAWAIEEARAAGLDIVEHRPRSRSWEAGYKPRNIQIAQDSDRVVCITVRELPPGYTGMRFKLCYHCGTDAHVKSGGCWTVKYAQRLGKPGEVLVVAGGPLPADESSC